MDLMSSSLIERCSPPDVNMSAVSFRPSPAGSKYPRTETRLSRRMTTFLWVEAEALFFTAVSPFGSCCYVRRSYVIFMRVFVNLLLFKGLALEPTPIERQRKDPPI